MTIKKIGGIKYTKTQAQKDNEWGEVFSHRNKLLSNSDWTQMEDSGLSDSCKLQWRNWRKTLRSVNRRNFGNILEAERIITKLSSRQPVNEYVADDIDSYSYEGFSLEDHRVRLVAFLNKTFNDAANRSFEDNPHLVNEQFEEAVDYLNRVEGSALNFPLIDVTSQIYGQSYDTVAEEFIQRKVEVIKKLAVAKKKYYYFLKLAIGATDDLQLMRLQEEIKQWISTST